MTTGEALETDERMTGLSRTFALIPGAGGAAWYWHRVVPLLCTAGHEAVAAHLPGDDPNAGLHEYARLVIAAIVGRADVMHVAQSLGGFTAPLAAEAVQVSAMLRVCGCRVCQAARRNHTGVHRQTGILRGGAGAAQMVTSLTALRAA